MTDISASTARILCVVGARPNFMKIAPIMRALADPRHGLQGILVHTGQHYDAAMKHAFFVRGGETRRQLSGDLKRLVPR